MLTGKTMKRHSYLNGHIIYNCFLSGYYSILKKKKYLNSINLFPVPDGDTGNNMVQTFYSALQIDSVDLSAGKTLDKIADKVLSGAKGNSGIIVSQFINSLSDSCRGTDKINTSDFSEALKKASEETYYAVNKPEEGTILTVIRVWSEEMLFLSRTYNDFKDLIIRSSYAVNRALNKTRHQLPVNKKADTVDAGASGFAAFLEGISTMVKSGIVPDRRKFLIPDNEVFIYDSEHEKIHSDEKINYRYCCEALITDIKYRSNKISGLISRHGDSMILSGNKRKTKIHLHSNNTVSLFNDISKCGIIIESKIDDMLMQHNIIYKRLSDTAVVTDSIADIPQNIIDKYQIHIINLNILWNSNLFIDRLSVNSSKMYFDMEKSRIQLSTSLPDRVKIKEKFLNLLSVYKSVIAVSVSSELSGTWQVMEKCAEELRNEGYKIRVIDSRLNSAAQGLVVAKAAEEASDNFSDDDIISNLIKRIEKSRIYVAVPTLKHMVRGGRVSPLTGFAAVLLNLKPVVSLDRDGKSIKFGAGFTKKSALKKIIDIFSVHKDEIDCCCIVYSDIQDEAELFAEKIFKAAGKKVEYIMEISSTVGIHTGKGVLAAAFILK